MSEQKTILVVEDEVALQDAIKIKLIKEGFIYVPAMTAEEGFLILEKQRPDFIWLDLLLPGMGGFAFLEKLRQMPSLRDLPVMVVSVSAGPEKIRRAFELNVVDYVVKSQYRLEDIIAKVKNMIIPQSQTQE